MVLYQVIIFIVTAKNIINLFALGVTEFDAVPQVDFNNCVNPTQKLIYIFSFFHPPTLSVLFLQPRCMSEFFLVGCCWTLTLLYIVGWLACHLLLGDVVGFERGAAWLHYHG